MTTTGATPRNHGLDTLRAAAIVFVMLHHYVLFVSHRDTFGWLGEIGWVGVDLFFALSGYLIGNQIFQGMRSSQAFSLPRFYARRLLRTLPNFYVVLALYYLWPWFRGDLDLLPLWRFLTFTQNINLMPGTAFSHAWSLCIEEQFYLVLPALALVIASLRRSLRWAWIAVAVAFCAGMAVRFTLWNELVASERGGVNYFMYIYYSTFCRFDELVAGVALALVRNYHPRAWQRMTAHGNLALAAGMGVCALAFSIFLANRFALYQNTFGFPLLALGFSLLILSALSERSVLKSARIPGAAQMALWAYAIYVTHKQVCILARAPLEQLGFGPNTAVAASLAMALSVLVGWVLYRAIEQPFMALRQRWVPTNFKPASA